MNATAQQTTGDKRPLILGAVLGLIAAVLVLVVLNQGDDGTPSQPAVPTSSVVIALRDIEPGVRITAEMVELRDVPNNVLARGAIRSTEDVIGKRVRYPLAQGEQLTTARLVETAAVQALSFQIPQGMRGMSIPVSGNQSPSALIAPGDFVDVLISTEPNRLRISQAPTSSPAGTAPVTGSERATATLIQNVQVISVGSRFVDDGVVYEPSTRGEPPGTAGYVTLAVTPEQAQILWLAQENGRLTIVLRPFGDEDFVPLTPFVEPYIIPQSR